MSASNHISQDDLLLFALQFLAEDEAATAHEHLLTCDDCRRQLSWIQGDLAGYALTAELHTPPAAARERLLRSIAKDKRTTTATHHVAEAPVVGASVTTLTATTPVAANSPVSVGTIATARVLSFDDAPVKRRMGVAGWAGWAVAACAVAAGGLQYQRSDGYRDELVKNQAELAQVSQQASKASLVMETLTDSLTTQASLSLPSTTPVTVPEGHASYLGRKGSLVFVANHLNLLTADKTYQLWLIPRGTGAVPIPAGTFRPNLNGHAHLVMASLPKDIDVAAFGVTIEPEGGSKSPTMPIVLVGE